MNQRPRLFDDLAGIAGGALSAVVGLRDEAESLARAKVDAVVRRLDLVHHEEIAIMESLEKILPGTCIPSETGISYMLFPIFLMFAVRFPPSS